jgi:hypothetical protein
MNEPMTPAALHHENGQFQGSGGRSEENVAVGFRPAFLDQETLAIYPSCFADGTPAPFHLLDGLPAEVVIERAVSGRVAAVKPSIVSGFTLGGEFYTREAAARCIRMCSTRSSGGHDVPDLRAVHVH